MSTEGSVTGGFPKPIGGWRFATQPHNFGKPMGFAVVTNADTKIPFMLDGGAHTSRNEAEAVCTSPEYAGTHHVVELMASVPPLRVAAHRFMYKSHDGTFRNETNAWIDGAPPEELLADFRANASNWKVEYAYAPASVGSAGAASHGRVQAAMPSQSELGHEQICDLLKIGNPTDEACRLIRLGYAAALNEAAPVPSPPAEWTPDQVNAFCNVALRNVQLVDEVGPTIAEIRQGVAAAQAVVFQQGGTPDAGVSPAVSVVSKDVDREVPISPVGQWLVVEDDGRRYTISKHSLAVMLQRDGGCEITALQALAPSALDGEVPLTKLERLVHTQAPSSKEGSAA